MPKILNAGQELELDLEDTSPWSVRGVCGGLTVLWGAYGSCKTFVAISLGVAVASGRPWFGHAVRQRPVVYIVGEGGWSMFCNRLRMAVRAVGGSPYDLRDFYAVPEPVDLSTPERAAALMAVIEEVKPGLVVVDTVSRCLPGDENKQETMQGFVAALDEIKARYDATVLAVHHANARGYMRGSTVLGGAADVILSVKKGTDGSGTHCVHVKADKLKELDTEGFTPRRLYHTVVDVLDRFGDFRLDEFGDKVTTLVLIEQEDNDKPREVEALATLEALAAGRPANQAVGFKEWLTASGQSASTLKRAIGGLLKLGKVVQAGRGHYYMADNVPERLEDVVLGDGYETLDPETRQRLENMESEPDFDE